MLLKEHAFRAWFYFRQGWATYFAFIFAALNTLTVTYYLAIENLPILKDIFPSFTHYVIILAVVGVPLLIFIGYAHYKKSVAFKTEADINIEANPHFMRILSNTEAIMPLYLKMSEMLIKLSKGEKMSDVEIEQFSDLQNQLRAHMEKSTTKNLRTKKFDY